MSFFKKKPRPAPRDEDVVILKQTRPNECGGTDATQRRSAPKEIVSTEMTRFSATSALPWKINAGPDENALGYVSAYAAPAAGGSFLYLVTADAYRRRDEKNSGWAFVKADVFPALVKLVNETGLARKNGYHSTTHGLPENFGGSVDIRYASGEQIDFSDNQAPILTTDTAMKIAALFTDARKGEKIPLPDVVALTEIRFAEERQDGGFTRAALTLAADGTATNKKTSCYTAPTVYESEKPVDAETVAAIKKTIADCAMLAWTDLPEHDFRIGGVKTLTFVFADGTEITVGGNKVLPAPLSGGFFTIELEMTTKH